MSYFPYNVDGATGAANSTPAAIATNHDWAVPTSTVPLTSTVALGTSTSSTYANVYGSTGVTTSTASPVTIIAGLANTYIYVTSLQVCAVKSGSSTQSANGYIILTAGTTPIAYVTCPISAGSCLTFTTPLRVSDASNTAGLSLGFISPVTSGGANGWTTTQPCIVYAQGFRFPK